MKKNPLLLFVFFIALFACNSNQEVVHTDTTIVSPTVTDDFKKLDTTLSFAGFWVNERYVESLMKTKSPTKADVPEYSCITVPARTLQLTGFVYGFHEGGEGLVVMKHGSGYEIWDEALQNKRFDITLISDNKLQIGKDRFVKIDNASGPESRFVEMLLFTGRYKMADATVEFAEDGRVKGLDGVGAYSVQYDYAAESDRVDVIWLGASHDQEKAFGFKFRNDSLYIYELKCADSSKNGDCYEKDYDKVKYVLVKAK